MKTRKVKSSFDRFFEKGHKPGQIMVSRTGAMYRVLETGAWKRLSAKEIEAIERKWEPTKQAERILEQSLSNETPPTP